jgi:DNA gyrase subunit A
MGRVTQGVRLINLRDGDSIASVARTDKEEEDETIVPEEGAELNGNEDTTGAEPTEDNTVEE